MRLLCLVMNWSSVVLDISLMLSRKGSSWSKNMDEVPMKFLREVFT